MKPGSTKDIRLFLLLIPIINLLNYFLTYNNIQFNGYFIQTLLMDTIQGYLCWLIIRYTIFKIEEKKPLIDFSVSRLVFQLAVTVVVGLLSIIIPTEILNAILKDTPVPTNFYTHDIFIFLIWILVINGIYIGMYYYDIWKSTTTTLTDERTLKAEGFSVRLGSRNIKIPLNEIRGFYVEDNSTYIVNADFKSHIIDSSLEKVEETLPAELFFRVNRKYILHRDAIKSFKRIENNKIEIETSIEDPTPTQLTISRLKAPDFKKWFGQDAASL
ncbi:LytR/AlgR family response regulator transcription factor [Flavobacterium wongokense]|uniref:LytR/AlgR family response regulator transcription factor n=1 Tax=Flavobacterium wongokense TaxID=2910674 RepID=UPI001F221E39|nr:LytTR family DNA-binding domain-containing protein [Flavobacterium sp. WG47]MCF6132317.1 LytTR family transcriptional regulator [Flavobacterium sp. WG47]